MDYKHYMMYNGLGSEQEPNPAFVRIIAPTDIQLVAREMARIIKDMYPGIDWLNPDLYRKLGMDPESKTVPWLQRLILLEKQLTRPLTLESALEFEGMLLERYPEYRREDVRDYIQAYIDVLEAGNVPESIAEPWDYILETPAEKIGTVLQKTGNKLIIAGAIVAVLYLIVKR